MMKLHQFVAIALDLGASCVRSNELTGFYASIRGVSLCLEIHDGNDVVSQRVTLSEIKASRLGPQEHIRAFIETTVGLLRRFH